MKRKLKQAFRILIMSISLHSFIAANNAYTQEQPEVTQEVFFEELSPYGQWISDAQYGYAWVPNAEDNFRPYATNGYWAMTEYGNTWISGYPWGWAAFHYGRWTYDPYYGWIWIPGYEWGPAWVSWRYGGGYYGWAPLGPWFTVTVGFGAYNCPNNWWVFIPHHQIYHRHPHYRPRNTTVINNTTIIVNTHVHNHTTIVTGPRAEDVRSVTGQNVQVHNLNDVKTPGTTNVQGNSVHMYRPTVIRKEANIAPANIIKGTRAIGEPKPVQSNVNHRPIFRDQTKPVQKYPERETEPSRTLPTPRKTVTPRQQPRQTTRPATQPAQKENMKPHTQPQRQKATPVQQRPTQKTDPKTTPQRQPSRR